jgi:hypothetical protein
LAGAGSEQENMMRQNGATVFALKGYSIKQVGEKFYMAPTACFTEKERWGKSYSTLHAATAAIARRLAEEWRERSKRQETFHRRRERAR